MYPSQNYHLDNWLVRRRKVRSRFGWVIEDSLCKIGYRNDWNRLRLLLRCWFGFSLICFDLRWNWGYVLGWMRFDFHKYLGLLAGWWFLNRFHSHLCHIKRDCCWTFLCQNKHGHERLHYLIHLIIDIHR